MLKKLLSMLLTIIIVFSSVSVVGATAVNDIQQEIVPTSSEENSEETQATETVEPTQEETEPPTAIAEVYPKITSIETANNGHKISWEALDSAYRYRLFVKRDDNSSWKAIATTKELSYVYTGLENNKEYVYTVRAVDENGAFSSSYNKDGWSFTYLESPKLSSLSSENDGLKLSWKKVEGAKNYKVYVRTGNSWKALGYTTTTNFLDKNVVSGKSYRYTVRCVTEDTKAFASYCDTKGITKMYVATPEITKVENVANGAKVSWNKVAGASKYKLFYKNGSSWKTIATTSQTAYTHAKLSNEDSYTYTVRACDNNGAYISSYNKTGVNNTFLSVPVIKSVTSTDTGLEIKWNKVTGAENYKVYVKSGNTWKAVGITNDTSFIDRAAVSGKAYTYTVRCISADGKKFCSYFDTKGVKGTFYETPVISKVENMPTGTKVSWNKVNGVAKYKLFYKKSDGSWKTIGTTTSTSFTHDKLSDGDVYIYTVRGCNSNGAYISGYNKTGVKNKFIAPIKFSSIECVDSKMVLSWKAESSAYGYRVYRKTFGGTWAKLSDVTDTTFTDTTALKDTVYTYTLRCINEKGATISYHITDTDYYYNGKLADGAINVNGSTYNFVNGKIKQGYVKINGNVYYYSSTGVLQKNGVVGNSKDGYCYADASGKIDYSVRKAYSKNGQDWNILDGKAYKVVTYSDRTLFRAFKEVDKALKGYDASKLTDAQKLKICFDYVKGAYIEKNPRIPHYRGMDWPQIYANDMFVNGVGNCLSYGAAFAYMAKAIGYEKVYCCHSGGHGWAEIDGLIYDPEWSRHRFDHTFFALSYDTKTSNNYKGAIAAGYPWMHIKI
ncbi:MAG: hypothetical protein IJ015_01955 [Ruminococcus sp.]|nr:hypothetical protein [Ruminococcus sp.]